MRTEMVRGFGAELRRQRGRRGMTQAQLAAKVGVTGKTISLWESGEQAPGVRVLGALMDTLSIGEIRRLLWIEMLRGDE